MSLDLSQAKKQNIYIISQISSRVCLRRSLTSTLEKQVEHTEAKVKKNIYI